MDPTDGSLIVIWADTANQYGALAGSANGRLVFCLPGSRGACELAWDKIIGPQLDTNTRPCNLAELLPRLRESPRARAIDSPDRLPKKYRPWR